MTLNITDWLPRFCQDISDLEVAAQGATLASLNQLEQDLGILLPPSHKDCLQIWDGAKDFGDWHIFSVADLRETVDYYGFKAGVSDPIGADRSFMYRGKPFALLPFAQRNWDADLFCFDTRVVQDGEYAIAQYDHETGDVTVRYHTFAELLQAQARDMTEVFEYFERGNRTDEEAMQLCDYWSDYLQQ